MKRKLGGRTPELRVHRQSKRAYATFNGRIVWFGLAGDPETQVAFDRFLGEWLARGRQLEPDPTISGISIRSLVARYLIHMEQKHDATWIANNAWRVRAALQPVLDAYGGEPAATFTPKALKAVRHTLIVSNRLCRGELNTRVQVIKKTFRWAASEELVPVATYQALATVEPLARGEYNVREGRTRTAVDQATFEATLPYLGPTVADILRLLWLTGCRPSELLNLCPRDIDRSGPVWTAELVAHKTARKGKARALDFGPKAQEILRRHLDRVPRPAPTKPIFAPERAVDENRALAREGRKTPLWPSHLDRLERDRARREPVEYRDRYDAGSLRKALDRGIRRANEERKEKELDPLPAWSPYQIRHASLSRIRAARGLEAAKAVGGHATALVTEGYSRSAERALAQEIAAELG